MWKTVVACALGLGMTAVCAKTLVVSYSFTGNADRIAAALVKELRRIRSRLNRRKKALITRRTTTRSAVTLSGRFVKSPIVRLHIRRLIRLRLTGLNTAL